MWLSGPCVVSLSTFYCFGPIVGGECVCESWCTGRLKQTAALC